MPISHNYKLIFIHIPKCAGISVWHSLGLDINPDNLISMGSPVLQHLLPKQLKADYIDKKVWNSYKKFTIIRNPYDRVMSDYFWMKEHASHIASGSFDDFLTLREDIVMNNKYDLDMYYDHFYPMHFYFENIKYDHVIRFENLKEEYEELRKLYNISGSLLKVNESTRNGFELDKKQKNRIYKLYEKDFLEFGYKKTYNPQKEGNNMNHNNGTLEMKEEVATPLPHTPVHIVNSILQPLRNIKVQVFWGDYSCSFSEEHSQQSYMELNDYSETVRFHIDSPIENVAYVRFDICDQLGLLNIHNILIQNKDGTPIWNWNPNEIKYKNDIVFIESDDFFPGKTVQLSLNNDPSFIVNLPESTTSNYKELVIDISLSSINDDQINVIGKKANAPLSFSSSGMLASKEIEIKEYQVEKGRLIETIQSLNDSISTLQNENTLVKGSIELNAKAINDFIRDKAFLSDELKNRSEIINTITSEKEELTKNHALLIAKKAELEKSKSELDKIKSQLEKELAHQHEKYTNLNFEKDNISTKKNELEKNLSELSKTATQYEKDLAIRKEVNQNLASENTKLTAEKNTLEKNLKVIIDQNKDVLEQNSILTSTTNKQQGHIQDLNKEKQNLFDRTRELSVIIDQQKEELNKVYTLNKESEQKNIMLEKSIKNLEEKLESLVERYEKRNLFQISIDRIFKAKRS